MKARSFTIFFGLMLSALFFVTVSVAERIEPEMAKAKVEAGALLVDVRSESEFRSGHVKGAIHVPHTEVNKRMVEFGTDKQRPIVIYCGSGRRAGLVEEKLQSSGFTQVFNAGGYKDWPKK